MKKILKQLRQEKELTQRELAKKLNLSSSTIAMYETGQRKPDSDTLEVIANFFDVSVDYLLGRTDKRNSEETSTLSENPTLKEIENLSKESKKELEKYIQLLKIKDEMDKGKDEQSSTLEKNA